MICIGNWLKWKSPFFVQRYWFDSFTTKSSINWIHQTGGGGLQFSSRLDCYCHWKWSVEHNSKRNCTNFAIHYIDNHPNERLLIRFPILNLQKECNLRSWKTATQHMPRRFRWTTCVQHRWRINWIDQFRFSTRLSSWFPTRIHQHSIVLAMDQRTHWHYTMPKIIQLNYQNKFEIISGFNSIKLEIMILI